jgi:hypothetical protein
MTDSKSIARWTSLAFVAVFAGSLLYLALAGQPSLYA